MLSRAEFWKPLGVLIASVMTESSLRRAEAWVRKLTGVVVGLEMDRSETGKGKIASRAKQLQSR